MGTQSKRILGFDVARVFSIIWIVAIYHALPSAHLPLIGPVKTITYSSLGIFTFLSAFLLASRYNFEEKGAIGLFYRKRVLRFYPLFFISSIILWLIGYNGLGVTVKGLLGVSPFWKPHPTTMWYCAMLISLYLITPFWAKGGIKRQIIKFLIIMGVICGVELVFHSVVPRTFCYYPIYFLGIILAQYDYGRFMKLIQSKSFFLVSCLLWLVILALEFFYNDQWLIIVNSGIGIMALLSFYMQIGKVVSEKKKIRIVSIIELLSYSSMCMYLFHREVQCLLLWVYRPESSITMMLYLGLLGLLITIPLSYFIQMLYDKSIKLFYEILHNARNSRVS